jgi:hypothetical protein
MESHSKEGKIQVTEKVCDFAKENFLLEERGEISIKGKGVMTTYFVVGKKSAFQKEIPEYPSLFSKSEPILESYDSEVDSAS